MSSNQTGSLKDIERKRKEVIKPILDSPFSKGFEWPPVDPHTSDQIMDHLSQLLSRYGSYLEMKHNNSGKNTPPPPEALKITIGFNSTVKRLEAQAAPNREKILGKPKRKSTKRTSNTFDETTGEICGQKFDKTSDLDDANNSLMSTSYVGFIFVARADITTTILTDCFPQLAFASSHSPSRRVKLVELPRGALGRLLKVLQTNNVTIISLCDDWNDAHLLFSLVRGKVPDVSVPWLEQLFDAKQSTYHKLNIAYLRTTAPLGKPKGQRSKQKPEIDQRAFESANPEHQKHELMLKRETSFDKRQVKRVKTDLAARK